MTAYYNDFDPGVCNWVEELIRRGLIAPGVVDRRSILEVEPSDLRGFTQVHFFAGIGGWSHALRLAGWPDDRPVWTGSPPCQPFSSAGQQKGRNDERHLAPKFASLVRACRPGVLFGEQVASAEVFGKAASGAGKRTGGEPAWAWLDDLSDRLEAAHYAVGASDFPSAGVGAPHIRQRTFFGAVDGLADADHAKRRLLVQPREDGRNGPNGGREETHGLSGARGEIHGVADPYNAGSQGRHGMPERADERPAGARGVESRQADAACCGRGEERQIGGRFSVGDSAEGRPAGHGASSSDSGLADAGNCAGQRGEPRAAFGRYSAEDGRDVPSAATDASDGFWATPDWLYCRDGKWRPVEPGTFPLAHGVPARVVRLRGYGNAINPHAAAQFIKAFDASIRHLRLTEMSEMANDTGDIFG